MKKSSITQKLKELCSWLKSIFLIPAKKHKQMLLEQVILLIFFLVFVSFVGFNTTRFLLYLLFVLVLFFLNNLEKSRWIVPLLGIFFVVLNLSIEKTQIQPEKHRKIKIDSINITTKKTVEPVILPNDSVSFRIEEVQTVTIGMSTQNSPNPIEIHNSIGYIDYSYKGLAFYNEIINLFEKDSIHFSLNEQYLDEELVHNEGIHFDELINMPKQKKMELWSKYEDSQDVYIRYHSEYLELIKKAYFCRGTIYDQLGFSDKALKDYERASLVILDKNVDYDIVYNQALCYLHLGYYSKALELVDQGIDNYSNPCELYFLKGYACFINNEDNQAIYNFEKAVNLEPRVFLFPIVNAYNYLGIAYFRTGDAERAIEAFGKAIYDCTNGNHNWWSNKRAVPFYINRSLVYRKLGKNDLADADENRVITYDMLYLYSKWYDCQFQL